MHRRQLTQQPALRHASATTIKEPQQTHNYTLIETSVSVMGEMENDEDEQMPQLVYIYFIYGSINLKPFGVSRGVDLESP